jgi:hypothetical protein
MSKNSSRRTRSETDLTETIRARCTRELKDRVLGFAKANNRTESAFLLEAVSEYMDRLERGEPPRFVNPSEKPNSPN